MPNSMPFTAGMPNTAALSRDSSPSKKWAAYPGGHAQDPTFDDAAQAVASGLCLQDGLGHGLAFGPHPPQGKAYPPWRRAAGPGRSQDRWS